MATLLQILIETLVLVGFLWIGKSIMKAQVGFKPLFFAAFAGAVASQVPFVGPYISFAVVLFFMWKMARVDMVPDGVLIVIIGKGAGLLVMIYAAAILIEHVGPKEAASLENMQVYVDEEGKGYFAEEDQLYYLDENGQQVYVDADEILGISEVMDMADPRGEGESQEEDPAPDAAAALAPPDPVEVAQEDPQPGLESDREPAAIFTGGFSEPQLSDAIVRGEPVPYQIFVPQGWQTRREANALNIRFNGHTYFHCSGFQEISDNNAYVRKELNRVLAGNPGYTVAKQEVITMDRKPWAKLQLMNSRSDQILLITHGGNRGCYTVELSGSFKQLNAQKAQLDRMISSFKFPPTTYFLAQLDTEE